MPESVRPSEPRPLRTLALLVSAALLSAFALVHGAAQGSAPSPGVLTRLLAPADTDSVATARPPAVDDAPPDALHLAPALTDSTRRDTTVADTTVTVRDSTAADSAVVDTTWRARRFLPGYRPDRRTASLFPRQRRPFSARIGTYWEHEVALDSTGSYYVARESVAGGDVRYPLVIDPDAYAAQRLDAGVERNWQAILEQRALRQQQQNRSGGLGLNIAVPGGRQTAFSTIFGEPTVDLRVTGQADIRAGFDYTQSDQQALLTGDASQVTPDFKQDLRLGVTGRIGDKMRIDVNWDTNRDFDYQNQLKLQYTGYEDEILQSVEAGNVFLNTPSTLIRGGQSLFGIKSEFQVGGVRLTTVASTQEGQANSLSIEGGSEPKPFTLDPLDYEARQHFFLGYYFRNRWEPAHLTNLGNPTIQPPFQRVAQIEVWKTDNSVAATNENQRRGVALVDLGEPPRLLSDADAYDETFIPSEDIDQYSPEVIQQFLVPSGATPKDFLESNQLPTPLSDKDYEVSAFRKLQPNVDYTYHEAFGYLTLTTPLQDDEALAVAYQIETDNGIITVGDINLAGGGDNGQDSDRIVLKLLRPSRLPQPAGTLNPAAWYLELRNIYKLGTNLNPTDFTLDIEYRPTGRQPKNKVADISTQQTLLQALGLDLVNEQGAASPDDLVDFFFINQAQGRLRFPYLEPFGRRIADLVVQNGGDAETVNEYAFFELYNQKPQNARNVSEKDIYQLVGESKGIVQSFYDLRAFSGLIPGSVRVTSGGTPLNEGTDYIVDYQGGTVTITNPTYLTAGRDIEIDYEQNSLFQLQTKTLLGARVDYGLDERLALGATVMRLSERSPTDKFRLGEEPIANTIWGVDGKLDLQPRWLTRAVDALPFLQTRAPSSFSLTGEFAQLRPGHTQTNAFEETRDRLLNDDRDFNSDELNGISYVDDFEGFENTFTFLQPGAWRLSSAPLNLPGVDDDPMNVGRDLDSLRTTWRGGLAWYALNQGAVETLRNQNVTAPDRYITLLQPDEVFENREREDRQSFLQILDLYFDPTERGPYNYTTRLDSFLFSPQKTWGGMVQRIPEGYNDFTTRNIEFLEFVVQVVGTDAQGVAPDAKLYVDMGIISEEVIPDDKFNTEDGLAINAEVDPGPVRWARIANGQPNNVVNIDEETGATEDVGLDGLASYPRFPTSFSPNLTEAGQFGDFLAALANQDASRLTGPQRTALEREIAKAQVDPSGDDFHSFEENEYYSQFYGASSSIGQRHLRFFPGTELNTIEAQSVLSTTGGRGNSRTPDTEDLDLNQTSDDDNNYYQYALSLHPDSLALQAQPQNVDDFVVSRVNQNTDWYLVRIPIRQFTDRVGTIENFGEMEAIRIWTTGHRAPVYLRFASLELVGSQWRASETIAREENGLREAPTPVPVDTPPTPELQDDTRLSIASINNEESGDVYAIPRGTVITQIRDVTSGGTRNAREQALVLRAENLREGNQRAVFKTYEGGRDLLKYSNLRMFAHVHGELADGRLLEEIPDLSEARSKVKLFVRLGANETSDYYEYEQPLTPSALNESGTPPEGYTDRLWQTYVDVPFASEPVDLNSMNIELSALNELKFLRDEQGVAVDRVLWSDDPQAGLDSLQARVERFAPPGTRIGIKGTPSLGRVNTIVIGIRNPDGSESVLEDVTLWVNELRASGYDERTGYATLLNADLALADVARVRAGFQYQTDGFGSLSSTLDERDQRTLQDWSVNTQFSLDKFIPERYGWNIPLSLELKSNTVTPRFDPNRGDVRVEDLVNALENNTELTEEERAQRIEETRESAETQTMTRSITGRVQKQGSRSRLLRNTLDGLSASYSYSESDGATPQLVRNDSWRWSTSAGYRLSIRKPRTVRPFGFLGEVPVVGTLGGLRFNYLPQALSLTGTANRRFTASQEREDRLDNDDELPDLVEFDLRDTQGFAHNRKFSLQYNPFNFLNLSFDTNTDQSLDAIGTDTLYTVIRVDSLGNEETLWFNDPTRDLEFAEQEGLIGPNDRGFEVDQLDVRPTGSVLSDLFSGNASPRTERYESRLNASFRPQLDRLGALDWLNLQDVSYSAVFSWRNGAVGNNTGATAGTSVDIRTGVTLRPNELWEKWGFYERLQEQQREAEAERQQRQQAREQERQRRRRERQEREDAQLRGDDEDEGTADAPPDRKTAGQAPTRQGEAEDALPEEAADAEAADADDGGPKLPFQLNPLGTLRRAFLAVTGVRDLNVTYSGTRSTDATNVGNLRSGVTDADSVATNYSLYDALVQGSGPPLGYRLGFSRDPGERVLNENVQVKDLLSNTHRFQGRASINPSRALRINLTWSMELSDREDVTYRQEEGFVDPVRTATESGDNRASVWAFGADYEALFREQFALLEANPQGSTDPNVEVVGTSESLAADFRQAYLRGLGTIGGKGLLPLPMPGWQITYSGISGWPIFRRLTQSASLRHGYSADYSTDFRTNLEAGTEDTFNSFGLPITYVVPQYDVGGVRVNERFQPLVGVDLSFKGNVQASVAWNRGNAYTLSVTNVQVREAQTSEVTATASYQLTGLSLPFLRGKRLNNQIGLSLTASLSSTLEESLALNRALQESVDEATDDIPGNAPVDGIYVEGSSINTSTDTSRLLLSPKISYRFSNRVSADFFLRYEKFNGDSRLPSNTTVNGGFNVRVSISN